MKLHADQRSGNYIQSATVDAVVVDGLSYTSPLVVTPDRILSDWSPPPLNELTVDSFQLILNLEPELILLGTGTAHQFVSNHLMTAIMSRGIGFEVMTTAAACRTYNVLSAEDRRVAAALLLKP
ncbi:MAG: Mth938-like domain-containing protein [Gammaproteobacteria bacterium]